ncbi:hypothetical protein F2Q70_00029191 [Brassica cretica]|uniref:Uncharacterized protein n=1 Tax=Brassica cretica TaxID=69181 RepID=A0A8S9FKJ1_BRACR|nr:hypothetical protein F2Q70_00029191 [Brassica cretica]KAF2553260.1 hypothetical protein F2Q68_00033568 [Brassica cretica]
MSIRSCRRKRDSIPELLSVVKDMVSTGTFDVFPSVPRLRTVLLPNSLDTEHGSCRCVLVTIVQITASYVHSDPVNNALVVIDMVTLQCIYKLAAFNLVHAYIAQFIFFRCIGCSLISLEIFRSYVNVQLVD